MNVALLTLALLAQAGAPDAPDPRCLALDRLYIAPMGEPFWVEDGSAAARWIAGADADSDQRISEAEFTADALRFHARLDRDGDGEIDPAELSVYENEIAPEIRLYQGGSLRQRDFRRRQRIKRTPGGDMPYDTPLGAAFWSQLNYPHPVASADLDLNRGVSRDEFASVARRRFAMIAQAGAISLAGLKPTPAQEEAALCASGKSKRRRR